MPPAGGVGFRLPRLLAHRPERPDRDAILRAKSRFCQPLNLDIGRLMEAYRFIEGFERVVAHFGMWPSFHDAEVLKLSVERTRVATALLSVLDLRLRGWVMTSEVTEQGFYKLRGDAVFHFQFEGITNLRVAGFNNQNVLSTLNLELIDDPNNQYRKILQVELERCYAFEASFTAQKAQVLGITPYVQ
ncbi:MAG: immunity 50 family protein [Zoogloeaceae bacterium]|jgi:hypothetical protein|nr:immunity 50 family protein [Zoogloeaceae bacterium]